MRFLLVETIDALPVNVFIHIFLLYEEFAVGVAFGLFQPQTKVKGCLSIDVGQNWNFKAATIR